MNVILKIYTKAFLILIITPDPDMTKIHKLTKKLMTIKNQ